MASVTFDHVYKRFGDVIAVNDLNIEIADKEFLVRLDVERRLPFAVWLVWKTLPKESSKLGIKLSTMSLQKTEILPWSSNLTLSTPI